jgi:hypothetical protein
VHFALDMDINRQPKRVNEWLAVHGAAPEDEQTRLEWKSTLDLRSKDAVASTVCKAIIAMSGYGRAVTGHLRP